jgi:Reactive mitochondrial oxygen species modulator 1
MSDKDKISSFSELLNSQIKDASEDKYDIKNFGTTKKESRLTVKWNRIKGIVFGKSGVSNKFFHGVLMGATVGAIAGTLFGLASFSQHKKIIYVPILALSMAVSFGFFMGVGTVIRTDNTPVLIENVSAVNNQIIFSLPDWKEKYKVRN